ncbi:hypothetical protein L0152_16555 [bacterium]|nr:hypothetical protein [bacterium]
MKQKIASLTIFVLVLCFATLTFAADKSVQAACSNATVKGSYGFYRSGTAPDGPHAAVGIVFFDGNGQAKGRQRISRNGTHHFSAFSLEYSIAKDCTFKSGPAYGVVVDNGKRIFGISMTEGNTISGVWERINTE